MSETGYSAAGATTAPDPFGAFLTYCPDPPKTGGPLSDMRLAVKDNIAVQGQPYTAGLAVFADRVGASDAACVRRLTDAGARFVGMTRTDTGGFGVTTPDVLNPVFPGHIVGGSSGGAAAAIAAGYADIGLGTDTGGSVRIPAACCGLFGFKPTHDRIPLDGVWPLAPSFDTVGLIARDLPMLERSARILMTLPNSGDTPRGTLRLGVDRERLAACEPQVTAAVEHALPRLADAGVILCPVTLPSREATMQAHAATVLGESYTHYRTWRDRLDLLPGLVRHAMLAAQALTPGAVAAAQRAIDSTIRTFNECCMGVHAIVTPTLPVLPPPASTRRMALNGQDQSIISVLIAETCLANVTGGPALSIPLGGTHNPAVSLQIVGRPGDDERLFAVARRIALILRH